MKKFNGEVLFLNREDINTDEIIPAKYLTAISKDELKPHLLEDLKIEGFNPETDIDETSVIVTRSNFGCGSSREHAVWAFEVNGINLVIASSFARIFRQNMYNCGMLAVELPVEVIENLFVKYSGKTVSIETDFEKGILNVKSNGTSEEISFKQSEFDHDLIVSGGWIEYADSRY
ncbi:3-isopropylmalate dehydratase small subunit 2 [Spirochaetota bacterium]